MNYKINNAFKIPKNHVLSQMLKKGDHPINKSDKKILKYFLTKIEN